MPSEEKFVDTSPGDGGGLYLPPPPRMTLQTDLHSELNDYDIDDEFTLTMTARVVEKTAEGAFRVELTEIKVPKIESVEERGRKEVAGPHGTISGGTLKRIFE